MEVTKFPNVLNSIFLKQICSNDPLGVFEGLARLLLEHGLPFENIAGCMYDMFNMFEKINVTEEQ